MWNIIYHSKVDSSCSSSAATLEHALIYTQTCTHPHARLLLSLATFIQKWQNIIFLPYKLSWFWRFHCSIISRVLQYTSNLWIPHSLLKKKKKTMNPLLTWNLLYLIYLQILVQHIKAILPGLKSRISSALVSVAKEHASYGEITESKACLILSRDSVKLGWDHCSINWIFIACYEVVNFVLGITANYKFVFYSSSVKCWMSFLFFGHCLVFINCTFIFTWLAASVG